MRRERQGLFVLALVFSSPAATDVNSESLRSNEIAELHHRNASSRTRKQVPRDSRNLKHLALISTSTRYYGQVDLQ